MWLAGCLPLLWLVVHLQVKMMWLARHWVCAMVVKCSYVNILRLAESLHLLWLVKRLRVIMLWLAGRLPLLWLEEQAYWWDWIRLWCRIHEQNHSLFPGLNNSNVMVRRITAMPSSQFKINKLFMWSFSTIKHVLH